MIDCDPEDEEDSALMQVFQELASIGGIDGLIILSSEDLRTIYAYLDKKTNFILPMSNITGIKHLQRFFNHLQQIGHYEIGIGFDCSSIDENDFLNFTCDPSNH